MQIGIDCPSIDIGTDNGFIAHKTLLSNQILVVENLCNLYRFNNDKFMHLITPLKLQALQVHPSVLSVSKNKM
jgi:arylformamidase